MAKSDLTPAQVSLVINALKTQRAVFERAQRAGDSELASVYARRINELDGVRSHFEGALL